MGSFLVRVAALLLSMLLFCIAWTESKDQISYFLGGCFFLVLFIASFSKEKYLYIFFGLIAIFTICVGLIDGEVFGFGRGALNYSIEKDPIRYWLTMGLWLCAALGWLAYGAYKAFIAKPSKEDNSK